jgi:hypothetical protein
LITSLEDAQQVEHPRRRVKTLAFPSLLVVDEIGYFPVSRTGAMLDQRETVGEPALSTAIITADFFRWRDTALHKSPRSYLHTARHQS